MGVVCLGWRWWLDVSGAGVEGMRMRMVVGLLGEGLVWLKGCLVLGEGKK